ncbi:hypothetical protein PACTADRAFT_184963 [Pachysolen tannophilus NRRL Y-2460]|uniref:Uncharacterized protein n=1 Tax=Pachysolen tannophilus NRRL Y-2460 TaxID=669874 RepID=A0A1E4U3J4_PACTA|nr:hypothetical protein PACTADRAFT_184963 [Pachysolen tannophilus NRRL Y-2460]
MDQFMDPFQVGNRNDLKKTEVHANGCVTLKITRETERNEGKEKEKEKNEEDDDAMLVDSTKPMNLLDPKSRLSKHWFNQPFDSNLNHDIGNRTPMGGNNRTTPQKRHPSSSSSFSLSGSSSNTFQAQARMGSIGSTNSNNYTRRKVSKKDESQVQEDKKPVPRKLKFARSMASLGNKFRESYYPSSSNDLSGLNESFINDTDSVNSKSSLFSKDSLNRFFTRSASLNNIRSSPKKKKKLSDQTPFLLDKDKANSPINDHLRKEFSKSNNNNNNDNLIEYSSSPNTTDYEISTPKMISSLEETLQFNPRDDPDYKNFLSSKNRIRSHNSTTQFQEMLAKHKRDIDQKNRNKGKERALEFICKATGQRNFSQASFRFSRYYER